MRRVPAQFQLARTSAGYAPLRPAGSIRRTITIDSNWSKGQGQPFEMVGRARDLVTPSDGEPIERALAEFRLDVSPRREILGAELRPFHPAGKNLIGLRAGNDFRRALVQAFGDVRGTPLFQLLDDFPGASLVTNAVWIYWQKDWEKAAWHRSGTVRDAQMVDICIGFAEGASSLLESGAPTLEKASSTRVGPLENPDDPIGWHGMSPQQGPQTRRARRIDLWRDGGLLHVDAGFQDSCCTPEGQRVAIHEYRVHAEIDAASEKLISLQVLPLILPFAECPGAAIKASRMIGASVAKLRTSVIETLPGPLGCSHLNDVLRSFADVPTLAAMLPAHDG